MKILKAFYSFLKYTFVDKWEEIINAEVDCKEHWANDFFKPYLDYIRTGKIND